MKRVVNKLKSNYGGGWKHKRILIDIYDLLKKQRDNACHVAQQPHATRLIKKIKVSCSFLRKEVKTNKTYRSQLHDASVNLGKGRVSHLGRGGKCNFQAYTVNTVCFQN